MKDGLSIIVPCYNEEKRIPPLLKSIEAQTVKPEAIFIDGGSTDKTAELVSAFAKRNKNIRLLRETGHKADLRSAFAGEARDFALQRSPANARNIGIKAATRNALVILNADAVLEKDYTKKIVNAFKEHPEADHVCFKHKPIVPKLGFFRKAVFLRDEAVNYSGGHGAMKTELQRKAGYYDPTLGFGEDRLIRRNFAKLGFKSVNVDETIGMSQTSYVDFRGFFSRCIWYGRTIPRYIRKERVWTLIAYYVLTIITIPLFFVAWLFPLNAALSVLLAVPFFQGILRAVRIARLGFVSKSLILIPFLEVVSFLGIGLGFYQYLSGNRTIGR